MPPDLARQALQVYEVARLTSDDFFHYAQMRKERVTANMERLMTEVKPALDALTRYTEESPQ